LAIASGSFASKSMTAIPLAMPVAMPRLMFGSWVNQEAISSGPAGRLRSGFQERRPDSSGSSSE
jgi:hypothetical protein